MTRSPDKYYSARILDRGDLSKDLCILRVDPGGPIEYRAGQYATLGIERDGVRIERAYSMVSSPYEEGLEFFVELVPKGGLTPCLFELAPGDMLLCRKIAKGRFMIDLRSGRTNHLLISTVTGVAPFVSYVRTIYRDWKSGSSSMPGEHRFFCLQGASQSFEFGYREELEHYASETPWFHYVPTVSRPWDKQQWNLASCRLEKGRYLGGSLLSNGCQGSRLFGLNRMRPNMATNHQSLVPSSCVRSVVLELPDNVVHCAQRYQYV